MHDSKDEQALKDSNTSPGLVFFLTYGGHLPVYQICIALGTMRERKKANEKIGESLYN